MFDPTRGMLVLMSTFIALLELSKEGLLAVTQAEAFAEIYVRLASRSRLTGHLTVHLTCRPGRPGAGF